MNSLVCTMAYGDFHLGAAVLANSLAANGFRGELRIGTNETKFPWMPAPDEAGRFPIAPGFNGQIVPWNPKGNTLLSKPGFLLHAIETNAGEFEDFFYFDADVVVCAPWDYYKRWVRLGVALCCDISDPHMPPTHPARGPWAALAQSSGRTVRPITGYMNAGFIGTVPEHASLLRCWDEFCNWFKHSYPDLDWMEATRDHTREWPGTDQDLFNAAIMGSDVPLSITGPAGMGFEYGRTVMLHAVGPRKPWRRSFFLEALRAWAPSRADKAFWRNCQGPLKPFSKAHRARKSLDLAMAKALSRFYGR